MSVRQNSDNPHETESSSSSSSVRQCPVVAALYENQTTPWSADKYVRLCSMIASTGGGGQHKRLVYTSTFNQLYIHVVNVTDTAHGAAEHVLLRYDGASNSSFVLFAQNDLREIQIIDHG